MPAGGWFGEKVAPRRLPPGFGPLVSAGTSGCPSAPESPSDLRHNGSYEKLTGVSRGSTSVAMGLSTPSTNEQRRGRCGGRSLGASSMGAGEQVNSGGRRRALICPHTLLLWGEALVGRKKLPGRLKLAARVAGLARRRRLPARSDESFRPGRAPWVRCLGGGLPVARRSPPRSSPRATSTQIEKLVVSMSRARKRDNSFSHSVHK
jgi:hypothetical protein